MLRACPHHAFTELAQIDTFYNGLNDNDQDSLNVMAGGNLLSKTTREALQTIENKSKCMHTRNLYFPNNSSVTIPRRQNKRRTPNVVEPELLTIVKVSPMEDNRTMEELLQA
nr:reverse transcriptase domain-containing protein [Tanacetum cinerariifolium]